MRGREQHRTGARGGELVGVEPALVHRDGDGLEAPVPRGRVIVRVPRIFEGHLLDAVAGECPVDQVDPLGEAGADHNAVGIGHRAADPPQIGGQHLPQPLVAASVAVAEGVGRGAAADLAHGPHPVLPREARQLGAAEPEVDVRAGSAGGRRE